MRRICTTDECTETHYAKGLCKWCYQRAKYRGISLEQRRLNCRKRYDETKTLVLARNRRYYFRKRYGLTVEEKQKRLDSQDGKCAICGTSDPKPHWCTDHDHETKQLRGELCHRCNVRLGLCDESIDLMSSKEASYVLSYQTT